MKEQVGVIYAKHTQKGGSFLSSVLGKLSNLGMKFGAKNLFKKQIDVASRAITSEIGKKLIDKGIKDAPELYKIGILKLKIKTSKKLLNLTLLTTSWRKHAKKQKKKKKKDVNNLLG